MRLFDLFIQKAIVGEGGGTAPTLISKSISSNGTYNASSDNADGYSSVTVNVPDKFKDYLNDTLTSVAIPDGTTKIRRRAFNNYTSLTNVILPSGALNIDYQAFLGCSNLEAINLVDTITSIGESAFENCTKAVIQSLPTNLVTLASYAFFNCSLLSSYIKLSNSITSIGTQAFRATGSDKTFDFTSWTIQNLDACTFGVNIFQGATQNLNLKFKYKSVCDYAKTVTNLSTYASYMTYEEDDT